MIENVGRSWGRGKVRVSSRKIDMSPWAIINKSGRRVGVYDPVSYETDFDFDSIPPLRKTRLEGFPKFDGWIKYRQWQLSDPNLWDRAHGNEHPFYLSFSKWLPSHQEISDEPRLNTDLSKEILTTFPIMRPYLENHEVLYGILHDGMEYIFDLERQVEYWKDRFYDSRTLQKQNIGDLAELREALDSIEGTTKQYKEPEDIGWGD